MTDTKQHVATEGYPFEYGFAQDCNFNFKAPSGRKIIVEFVHFFLSRVDYLFFRKLHMDLHKYSENILSMQYIFLQNKQMAFSFKLCALFCISANKVGYYKDPPTFRSDSNTATLRFDSFFGHRGEFFGILMAYRLGKYFYFYWLFEIVNKIPLMGDTFTGTISSHW